MKSEQSIESVLITCHSLRILSGSELVTLDVAGYFRSKGVEVFCAAFDIDEPVRSMFLSLGVEVVNLIDRPEFVLRKKFDLIWAHHWPVIGYCLCELGIEYKCLVYSSLSAFEPLELVSIVEPIADVVVCNSQSTMDAHLADELISESCKLQVLTNSLDNAWFSPIVEKRDKGNPLKNLAVISNHIPNEVLAAIPLLEIAGVTVLKIGMESKQILVDANLIKSFDAVITIGHSVQKCLASGVPVYCYDRFGGPGWLTESNFNEAEYHNFSGRCCYRKLNNHEIASEVVVGFSSALEAAGEKQMLSRDRYNLGDNLEAVIRSLDFCTKSKYLPVTNNSLRKITQLYMRTKFNVNIPSVVNLTPNLRYNTARFLRFGFVPVQASDESQELAYFGLSPLPNFVHFNALPLSIVGVALSKSNEKKVGEVALLRDGLRSSVARLHLPSPGIGNHFPSLNCSGNSGFAFVIAPSVEKMSGTFEVQVKLLGGQEILVGQLVVTEVSEIDR